MNNRDIDFDDWCCWTGLDPGLAESMDVFKEEYFDGPYAGLDTTMGETMLELYRDIDADVVALFDMDRVSRHLKRLGWYFLPSGPVERGRNLYWYHSFRSSR